MNICDEFKRKLIDYLEDELINKERKQFDDHLQHCERCQTEYTRVKRLYAILDKDEVILPEQEFFDNLRIKVRQSKVALRRFHIGKIIRILIPAFAAAMIILLLNRPQKTVEFSVPTAALLEDKEIASLSLDGIISDELINELSVIEDDLPLHMDEFIKELSDEEVDEFIKSLAKKYGVDI